MLRPRLWQRKNEVDRRPAVDGGARGSRAVREQEWMKAARRRDELASSSGVTPAPSATSACARASSSSRVRMARSRHAACSGDVPFAETSSVDAPAASSKRAHSAWPARHARSKGELPCCSVQRLTKRSDTHRVATSVARPSRAATWRSQGSIVATHGAQRGLWIWTQPATDPQSCALRVSCEDRGVKAPAGRSCWKNSFLPASFLMVCFLASAPFLDMLDFFAF